jgi:DNA-directed RNA polymerase specialized sigma24 family protein
VGKASGKLGSVCAKSQVGEGISLGYTGPVFPTTHWSVVLSVRAAGSPAVRDAWEKLGRGYWYPIYAFVRRRGYDAEEAQDLTQGFFERLLERSVVNTAARERGRFRSFLLTVLKHFLADEHTRQAALKRGGAVTFLDLGEADAEARFQAGLSVAPSPDASFDQAWAHSVMRHAWRRLRIEQEADGKARQFETLKPFLARRAQEGEYSTLGPDLGLSTHAMAEAVSRLRQQYRECVRSEVAQTVSTPAEIDEEMRYLVEILASGGHDRPLSHD